MLRSSALVSCPLVVALSASVVRAQQQVYKLSGASDQRIGAAVSSAGDVDADGFEDVIATNAYGGGARVFSGRTGALLHSIPTTNTVGAAGDVDGDGHGDLIVGHSYLWATGPTPVWVYSGASGALLFTFPGTPGDAFGLSLCGIGDLDGDGHDDVLVGAPKASVGTSMTGAAYVFSGADGSTLATFTGATGDMLGVVVARAGDFDHDGARDFLVGANTGDYVQVRSGVSGTLLRTVPMGGHCWAAADAGDVDLDGTPDLVVGTESALPPSAESVVIASGATGAILTTIVGPTNYGAYFGRSVAGVGDWDGDGHADVLVGAPRDSLFGSWSGAARVYSGTSGALLAAWYGSEDGKELGSGVASLQLDGDGHGDLVIGAPGEGPLIHTTGIVHVYLSGTPTPTAYCSAKVNSLGCTPRIKSSGAASLTVGDNFTLRAVDVLNQKSGILFYGLAAAATPFHGGTLCVNAWVWRTPLQNSGGSPANTNDCSGVYSFHFSQALMAFNGFGPGRHVFAQYWSRDPGFAPPNAIGLSDALEFAIGL